MSKGKTLQICQLRQICEACLCGMPHRLIATQCHCSPSTVSVVEQRMKLANIFNVAMIEGMSDQGVLDMYYGQGRAIWSQSDVIVIRQNRRKEQANGDIRILDPDYEYLSERAIDGKESKSVLYASYLKQCELKQCKAVCRTGFYDGLNRVIGKKLGPNVFMRQSHQYGHELAIDYCGDTIGILTADGSIKQYAVCVLAWAASNMVYAEIIPGQTTKDTCLAIANAMVLWQCHPRVLVCDNAKSMVTKHATGREPILNPSFEHYVHSLGISVMANNPYSPSSKGYVELAVRLVQDRCLTVLRREPRALDLTEANAKLMDLVDSQINAAGFRDNCTGTPRKVLFAQCEAPAALALPIKAIREFTEYLPGIRVGRDYLVRVKGHMYSVPWRFAGQLANVELTPRMVYIYIGGEPVARHVRNDDDGCISITPEHRKSEHLARDAKLQTFPDVECVMHVATQLSPTLATFCQGFFAEHDFTEAGNGPIHLIRKYEGSPEQKSLFDEALQALMNKERRQWTSYGFDAELKALRKRRQNTGLRDVSSENLCLRGQEAFTNDALDASATDNSTDKTYQE